MTDIKEILSVVITNNSRLKELPTKNYQLIFARDTKTIALDFNGKRTTYSQIVTLRSENERLAVLAPVKDVFYFVYETSCLWTYDSKWIQITTPPREVLFKSSTTQEFPPVGNELCLYIAENENKLYRWDDTTIKYYCVGSDYNDIKIINGGGA